MVRKSDDISAIYERESSDPHVIVAGGHGISITVNHGKLTVHDGIGKFQRAREYSRVERKLRRIVIIGHVGYVSLQAHRWCRDVGITLVNIDKDGAMLWSSTDTAESARLLRMQALAGETDIGLGIVKLILSEKIREQASTILLNLDSTEAADHVAEHVSMLDDAATVDDCRTIEAQAASSYWAAMFKTNVQCIPINARPFPDTCPLAVTSEAASLPERFHCGNHTRSNRPH
jgi:CRISP-associated protein Cas1